jgi:S1-C subfamily serine protease
MKKIILILFIILVLFFTVNIQAAGIGQPPQGKDDFSGILKKVSPSIVKVISENHKFYFATGIAIGRDLVISNRKVTPRHYSRIFIRTVDGKEYPATLKAMDPLSSVILLKLEKKVLKPIKRGKGGNVGERVALVGAFYHEFPALYQGMVSVSTDERMLLNAPAVPGVSGGAVVNRDGELVAVVRGRFGYAVRPDYTYVGPEAEVVIHSSRSRHKDLCYALPVDMVYRISDDLNKHGRVRRGWFGIRLEKFHNKVAIKEVTRNSPAFIAGIRPGDVILKIDKKTVRNPRDVSKIAHMLKPEQKVKVDLVRGKLNRSTLVVMGEASPKGFSYKFQVGSVAKVDSVTVPELPESLPTVENYVFRFISSRSLGVDVVVLNPELAREFKVKDGKGLMVSRIYKSSAAEKAGFRAADVIVKVNNRTISRNSDLRAVLNNLQDNQKARVTFYRKGTLMNIVLVPDKGKHVGTIFERISDKMEDLHIKIDNDNLLRTEEVEKAREKRLKKAKSAEAKKLEVYKAALEKMQKDQQKLQREMKILKELMEKQKNADKNKKKKNKEGTKI